MLCEFETFQYLFLFFHTRFVNKQYRSIKDGSCFLLDIRNNTRFSFLTRDNNSNNRQIQYCCPPSYKCAISERCRWQIPMWLFCSCLMLLFSRIFYDYMKIGTSKITLINIVYTFDKNRVFNKLLPRGEGWCW